MYVILRSPLQNSHFNLTIYNIEFYNTQTKFNQTTIFFVAMMNIKNYLQRHNLEINARNIIFALQK